MRLNLGACDRKVPGFLSVDIVPPADFVADLSKPWPWPDSSVDEVAAFDIIEHLPDKRHTMNELWRVLKNGARASIGVPTVRGVGSVCDPTHVSYWSAGDFEYYEKGNFARERFRSYYGIVADFRIVSLSQDMYKNRFDEEVWKASVVLEAVK
jgi:ubiquinone/menaquinone biosynthesis C-methylase UbiE